MFNVLLINWVMDEVKVGLLLDFMVIGSLCWGMVLLSNSLIIVVVVLFLVVDVLVYLEKVFISI